MNPLDYCLQKASEIPYVKGQQLYTPCNRSARLLVDEDVL